MKALKVTVPLVILMLISGCGTQRYNVIQPPIQPMKSVSVIEIKEFENAIPQFENQSTKIKDSFYEMVPVIKNELKVAFNDIGYTFATEGSRLILESRITNLNPGNQFLRWFFGMGAGAGKIVMEVTYRDNDNKIISSGIAEGGVTMGVGGGEMTVAAKRLALAITNFIESDKANFKEGKIK